MRGRVERLPRVVLRMQMERMMALRCRCLGLALCLLLLRKTASMECRKVRNLKKKFKKLITTMY
jgi:hypothetical protein